MRAQMDKVVDAYERAAAHAELAGLADRLLGLRNMGLVHGSTPLTQFLDWQDKRDALEQRDQWLRGYRALALAMLGRFDEARAILRELLAEVAERGGGFALGGIRGEAAIDVELLAGDPAAAVVVGEEACRLLEELDQPSALSTVAGRLAHAYYELDKLEETDAWADRAAELGASDDAITQMLWREARAKVLARRGDHDEAERLAREAVAIGEETEMLDDQADAYADLGAVLALAGRSGEAAEALEQALERFERKENLVMAARTRARLEALSETV